MSSAARALPELELKQADAEALLKEHYTGRLRPGSLKLMEKVFTHPSVRTRRFAVEAPASVLDEDPDKRAARFTACAAGLGAVAASAVMEKTGLKAGEISALVVNTCTGYICPGLSTYIAERLGFDRATKAYDLVGSGCGGAIPNIQLAAALAKERPGSAVLSVAVEICSSVFEMGDDTSLIISNALFGDGAAAAALWDRPSGFELVDSMSRFAPQYREDIRFVHKNGRLHNQLSAGLPAFAAAEAGALVDELLKANGFAKGDIFRWAVHPGGENVIQAVQERLGLGEEAMKYTRKVLSELGNMSSPTVLVILDEIEKEGVPPGALVVMLAFGAGFAAHALLLRKK
jgi:predicted naringenin-chalcone synthase